MPSVNPKILTWARGSAGLNVEQAVRKLRIAPLRLANLESGKIHPTSAMLERMAKVYRQPLIAFYMVNPPHECDYGVDFRAQHSVHKATNLDANLKALIRDIRVSQGILKAALEDEEEASNLPFVASLKTSDGVAKVVTQLHSVVGMSAPQYYAMSKPASAFNLLRDRTHDAGVFVLLKNDLGSYHSKIDLDQFRGFVIADAMAPFVVINGQDAKSALSFTLLHELAHLILGNTGISGMDSENDIEKFCNDVASNFLLPTDELKNLQLGLATEFATVADRIGMFSKKRNLSRSMVAYRAWRSGKITFQSYRSLNERFRNEWHQSAKNRRDSSGERQGGPGYYVRHKYQIGKKLIDTTQELLLSGALTTLKAAKILNVKTGNMQNIFDSK